ncbi:hypothetical protein [Hahella sp. HN01]|uniref:hypothetical protein n=1 Tax=unclassified Hahella TaxID=2624107 RepID=UPI001C1EF4B4|nr:hypothetical protein [Hahella sp. HN01]MBU6954015.1 hypothetical protein [Hahella sp. HN01]
MHSDFRFRSAKLNQLLDNEIREGNSVWNVTRGEQAYLVEEFKTSARDLGLKSERMADRNISFLRYVDPETGEFLQYDYSW